MDWNNLSDYIINQLLKHRSFESELNSLSSNEERIKYCLANTEIEDLLTKFVDSNSAKHLKYWEKAKEHRIDGNDWFKKKCFTDAIECYTKAILSAPQELNCEELSLAFANRSAVFFQLNQYSNCLKDISFAMKYNYPQRLMNKLLIRKAECLIKTKRYDEAKHVLCSVQNADKDVTKIESLMHCISISGDVISRNSLNIKSTETNNDSALKFVSNPQMPNSSSMIELCVSETKGRYIKAKQNINKCDILFVEKPFASVLLPQFYSTRCHHCYIELVDSVILPCCQCNRVRYCSEQCTDQSWSLYHKYECESLDVLHNIGIAHLAFRVLEICGINNAINSLNTSVISMPYTNDYNSVFALIDHCDHYLTEDMMRYSLVASLLLLLCEKVRLIDRKTDYFYQIGAILLKHVLQLITNGHAISSVDSVNSSQLSFQDMRIATAIYPTVSLMNHSCDPNVIAVYDSDVLIIKASKDILANEEVANCYGPHCKRMPKIERQRLLKQQYFFDCECKSCLDETPDPCRALLCDSCNGAVIVDEITRENAFCVNCKKKNFDTKILFEKVDKGMALLANGTQLIDNNMCLDGEQILLEAYRILSECLYCNHRDLGKVNDELSRCYARMRNWHKSVEFGRESVKIVGQVFGDNSIEMCNELIKLSDLEWEWFDTIERKDEALISAKSCLIATSRSLKLLSVFSVPNGKSNHNNVNEIKKLEERLIFCNLYIQKFNP